MRKSGSSERETMPIAKGCPDPRWKHGISFYKSTGRWFVNVGDHTYRLRSIILAEEKLGKSLPRGAMVHHVDLNRANDSPSNLVICPDAKYHKLLHRRTKIFLHGGNPNTQDYCSSCNQIKPRENFYQRRDRYTPKSQCNRCLNEYHSQWSKFKKDNHVTNDLAQRPTRSRLQRASTE